MRVLILALLALHSADAFGAAPMLLRPTGCNIFCGLNLVRSCYVVLFHFVLILDFSNRIMAHSEKKYGEKKRQRDRPKEK